MGRIVPSPPSRVLAYCCEHRDVSAIAQGEQAAAYFAKVLQPRGLVWGGVYSDQAGWSRLELVRRVGGVALATELDKGDHVVIAKTVAAFKDTWDLAYQLQAWVGRGIAVHLLDQGVELSGPTGRKAVQVLEKVLGLTGEYHGDRIKRALAIRRARGQPTGGHPPYGFRMFRGRLVPDEHSRSIGRRIVQMRQEGVTFRGIYFRFLQERVCTRKGREISLGTIERWHAGELAIAEDEAQAAERSAP